MRQKRLLIFTDFFTPHWTGVSKSIDYLTKGIGNHYKITVLTVRFDKSLKKKENLGRVRVLREDFAFALSRSKYSVRIIFRFLGIVKNFDVVVINSPSSNILPIAIITKIFGKKLIIFHQGDLILPKGFINRIIEKIFDISCYFSFLISDKVSTYTADYGKNSRVIRNFLSKFEPMLVPIYLTKTTDKIRLIQDLKKEKLYIFGFAGRFVEEKGFDILLDAIPAVIKERKDVKFVFAGEANITYENFYQKNQDKLSRINEHVIILGLLGEYDIVKFYNSLDFLIVPSRSDCFNLVQAEAMVRGIPSIVSNIPGARFLVDETSFGLKFKLEDSSDLGKAILSAIKNKDMFKKKWIKVKEILNNNQNVKKIEDIIG